MIHRTHRFHGRSSLRYAYQRGKTVRTPLCSLRFVLNSRRTDYRVAVVVSRKVSKSAVVRNRIRRRTYEIIRAHNDAIRQPYDLVFTVFSEQLADMESAALGDLILEQLQKASVIDNKNRGADDVHAIVKAKELTG
jgi:ribonuclease P protein component